jgi:mono/diheme cytochrome c family protein
MKKCAVAICYFLFCAISLGHAQESTSMGVFTEQQAKLGAAAYRANCASCHGAELRSTDREIPHLAEKSFKFSWEGKTIAEKFEIIRSTMPPKEERSLDDQVYLDILTYILRFNGIPPGSKPLEPDVKTLGQIVISVPSN